MKRCLVTEEKWPWLLRSPDNMHQLQSVFSFWFVLYFLKVHMWETALKAILFLWRVCCYQKPQCVFQGTHHEQAWWKCTTISCPGERDLSSRKRLVDFNGQVMLLREDEVVYCISKKLLRGKVTSVALQIRLDVSFLSLKQMLEFAMRLWGAACLYFSYGSVCKPHLSVICIWTLLLSVS